MEMKGSDIVVECLLEQGVDTVFGYPGGTILEIYDSLYKYQDKINHVLTSHEQGAAHAADGYARATGKVGVCMATSGPGATNLVTGIATAQMDSIPLVAITANQVVPLLGKDSFQEVDITGVTMPITKHNFIVKRVEDLAPTIRKAFQIAKEPKISFAFSCIFSYDSSYSSKFFFTTSHIHTSLALFILSNTGKASFVISLHIYIFCIYVSISSTSATETVLLSISIFLFTYIPINITNKINIITISFFIFPPL